MGRKDERLDAALKMKVPLPLPRLPRPLRRPPQPRKRHRNHLAFETHSLLPRMMGVDLTKIEGIDETTALIVLGEVGLDMSRWPSASPQEFLCMPLGTPRSSVASRPGWSPALPGKRHCTICLEDMYYSIQEKDPSKQQA